MIGPITLTNDQNPDFSGLDRTLISFLEDNEYTGATIGIVSNGRLVYTQGYGHTVDGSDMLPSKLLHSSSISKSITAVGILKLVQENKLGLDESVFGDSGILSHLHLAKHHQITDPRIYEITVRYLLQHSGGWYHRDDPVYDAVLNKIHLSQGSDNAEAMDIRGNQSPDNFIKYMITQPLDFTPGTKYQYSNFGYLVLGRVIEAVTKRKYKTYITDEILTPLGMWQTQIGPMEHDHTSSNLKFDALAGSDLADRQSAYEFLDSALGWYSTVYDLLRFSEKIPSILVPESLQNMLERPFINEHSNTWHGLGVHINIHNSWWQTADTHDNELILYNQAMSTQQGRHVQKTVESYVIMLSQNNRKDIRKLMTNAINTVQHWPDEDLFTTDCADSIHRVTDGSVILMKYRLAEHQIQAYGAALAYYKFYPIWINGHIIKGNTYFSVIFQQNPQNEETIEVFYDLDNYKVNEIISTRPLSSPNVQYMTSYVSHKHNGHIHYVVVVGSGGNGGKHINWHEKLGKYEQRLAEVKENGQVPVVQTVKNHNGQNYVTVVVEDKKVSNWKSYTNISMHSLDGLIKQNAKALRTLFYLDARTEEEDGGVKFSAVFCQQKYADWLVHVKLSESQLKEEIHKLKGLTYSPKIVVGYEMKGKTYYSVMWGKPSGR
ncbi:uncharacterized protein LOC144437971 [Glandiceps talaboti]